jgi:hypothetical protein
MKNIHLQLLDRAMRLRTWSAGSVVLAGMLAGCHSANEYQPQATPTELSAYAASTKFPTDAQPQFNPYITAVVDGGAKQLTIRNFDGPSLVNFNVWVNKTYVLHVDRLDPKKAKLINLGDMYNSSGNNDLTPDKVSTVQVVMPDGKLYNVQGPQMM